MIFFKIPFGFLSFSFVSFLLAPSCYLNGSKYSTLKEKIFQNRMTNKEKFGIIL